MRSLATAFAFSHSFGIVLLCSLCCIHLQRCRDWGSNLSTHHYHQERVGFAQVSVSLKPRLQAGSNRKKAVLGWPLIQQDLGGEKPTAPLLELIMQVVYGRAPVVATEKQRQVLLQLSHGSGTQVPLTRTGRIYKLLLDTNEHLPLLGPLGLIMMDFRTKTAWRIWSWLPNSGP